MDKELKLLRLMQLSDSAEEKEVTLVEYGGARFVFDHNGLVNGAL